MHSIPRHSDIALIHTAHVTRVGEAEIGAWMGSGCDRDAWGRGSDFKTENIFSKYQKFCCLLVNPRTQRYNRYKSDLELNCMNKMEHGTNLKNLHFLLLNNI